jgi:hypothetical protein
LQRLYHAGFLDRPHAQLPLRFAGDLFELVYAPTQKIPAPENGTRTVSAKKYGQISSLFLRHALSVSDALIALELACRQHGRVFTTEQKIVDFGSEREGAKHLRWRVTLKSGEFNEKIGIIPDAAFAIERPNHAGREHR